MNYPYRDRRTDAIEKVDAVLPAGGRLEGEFAKETGEEVKALVKIGGISLLSRVIAALRNSGCVDRIVVIGPDSLSPETTALQTDLIAEGNSGPENIQRGLHHIVERTSEPDKRVLICTTDLPFLCGASIRQFLECCPADADFAIPVITQETLERRFPGLTNTYTPLKEGKFAPGGIFLVRPATLERNKAYLEQAFDARKSDLAMAKLLGPAFILKYLFKQLSVRDLEQKCSTVLRCVGRAVIGAPPELAFDIDLPEEYRWAVGIADSEDKAVRDAPAS